MLQVVQDTVPAIPVGVVMYLMGHAQAMIEEERNQETTDDVDQAVSQAMMMVHELTHEYYNNNNIVAPAYLA